MFGSPKDTIEYSNTPRPGGIEDRQVYRGGIFGQQATPFGRPELFQTQYNMPPSVAAQDYGLIAPDNVSPLPHSIMGMGCAGGQCCPQQGLGCIDFRAIGSTILGTVISLGALYLIYKGAMALIESKKKAA